MIYEGEMRMDLGRGSLVYVVDGSAFDYTTFHSLVIRNNVF